MIWYNIPRQFLIVLSGPEIILCYIYVVVNTNWFIIQVVSLGVKETYYVYMAKKNYMCVFNFHFPRVKNIHPKHKRSFHVRNFVKPF